MTPEALSPAPATPALPAGTACPAREARGLAVIRIGVALILAVHPLHGLWSGGHWGQDVTGFGQFLSSQGWPFGVALAWVTILSQLLGTLALVARRGVAPACAVLAGILAMGIWIVHRPDGWFVVGAGRNGMEFSVLLIACLTGLALAHWPRPGRP